MRTQAWLLLVALTTLQAQPPALQLDLSGSWRNHEGDNPAWARPDFDDSGWNTIQAPFRDERPAGFRWIRRTVTLPEWLAPDTPLTLSTGAFEFVFEVFLNGERIGGAGSPSVFDLYVPRPHSFALPSRFGQPGARLCIAIRAWRAPGSWPRPLEVNAEMPDQGPWLITTTAHAPAPDAGRSLRLRLAMYDRLTVLPAFYASLILLVLFAWTMQRERRELLFVVGYLVAEEIVVGSGRVILQRDLPLSWTLPTAPFVAAASLMLSLFAVRVQPGFWRWTPAPIVASLLFVSGINSYYLWTRPATIRTELYALAGFCEAIAIGLMVVGTFRSVQIFRRCGDREGAGLAILNGAVYLLGTSFIRIYQLIPIAVAVAPFMNAAFAMWVSLRMLAGLGAARQRLTDELEAARTVQSLLLAASVPAGVEAVYVPAQEVGGDFWHVFDRLVVVGDVSGKGLKAAMIVSLVTGVLRNRGSDSPARVLAELNAALVGNPGFVTCCVVRLECDQTLTIANAGHPAPYVGGHEVEVPGGLPLGVAADVEYAEMKVAFSGPLTLVSDGVIEAANGEGELFGFERTREISTKSASEIAEAARAWGQNDDITVVTMRRSA